MALVTGGSAAMAFVQTNGVRLAYQRSGHGAPVLMIMGTGAAGRVWTVHQTPALNAAGYETIVFDNRGVAPSDSPEGKYSLGDLVADTAGLIEALDLGPCRIVGTSLGAIIAQELAVLRPELVRCAVLMATRARSDAARRALAAAEIAEIEAGTRPPPEAAAAATAFRMLSPATLDDDAVVRGWLDVFSLSGGAAAPGQAYVEIDGDHRAALRGVHAPCRVIAFADDLICPPHLAREVAEAIPDCDFLLVSECGHLGNLERPDVVNAAVIEFLDRN
jgi:pimeloyl-ACP methyl ester carboxylesterase